MDTFHTPSDLENQNLSKMAVLGIWLLNLEGVTFHEAFQKAFTKAARFLAIP